MRPLSLFSCCCFWIAICVAMCLTMGLYNISYNGNVTSNNTRPLHQYAPESQIKEEVSTTSNVLNCGNKPVKWSNVGEPGSSFGCEVKERLDWVLSLKDKEKKIYSQNGEDGITEAIFEYIGHGDRFFVEFGVQSGMQCSTRILRENFNWSGVMFDGGNENESIGLHQESVWVDNVVQLFNDHQVPLKFDYLSVDTDFADFWLLKTIMEAGFRPRAIVCEINRNFNAFASLTVPLEFAKNHHR